jgi:hypothetical protein
VPLEAEVNEGVFIETVDDGDFVDNGRKLVIDIEGKIDFCFCDLDD